MQVTRTRPQEHRSAHRHMHAMRMGALADVAVQRAHHDHGDHAGQEEDDHEGVDDAEPVDLVVRHEQVGVPARGPADVALLQQQQRDAVSRCCSSGFEARYIRMHATQDDMNALMDAHCDVIQEYLAAAGCGRCTLKLTS